jgi:hypothetical protein
MDDSTAWPHTRAMKKSQSSPFVVISNWPKLDLSLKNQVFWDETLCRWVGSYRRLTLASFFIFYIIKLDIGVLLYFLYYQSKL